MKRYDAVVVGAGPNGLAAAVTLARAGRRVLVREARPTIGGGARSAELMLPGVIHDVCSAVHPMTLSSPFLRTLPLHEHGLEWIQPPVPFAHPLDDGTAVVLARSVAETAAGLGRDGAAYRGLMAPLVEHWFRLMEDVLAPLHLPAHPRLLARFAVPAVRSARGLAKARFRGDRARALFAGAAAHSVLPLPRAGTAAFGLVLSAAGHAVGWPLPRGGAQRIADALGSYLRSLGGEIVTDAPVRRMADVSSARCMLFDVTPLQLLRIAGDALPGRYRRRLARYRYGPGVFKMDWVLSEPIPWTAPACRRAGTVHLGGTLGEIATAEAAPWRGEHAQRPFVILVQPSRFDPTRAREGRHTAWAYCHVPNGSERDMTEALERQVERYAPGFRDIVVARHRMGPRELERHNPNLVGGDINGGAQDLPQLFFRPAARRVPYATPVRGLYLCSSSTPPGGGVHGMCGHHAARAALNDGF